MGWFTVLLISGHIFAYFMVYHSCGHHWVHLTDYVTTYYVTIGKDGKVMLQQWWWLIRMTIDGDNDWWGWRLMMTMISYFIYMALLCMTNDVTQILVSIGFFRIVKTWKWYFFHIPGARRCTSNCKCNCRSFQLTEKHLNFMGMYVFNCLHELTKFHWTDFYYETEFCFHVTQMFVVLLVQY